MISQEKLQGAGGARATGFLSDSRDLSRIVDSQKSRTQAQRSNQGVAQGSQAVFQGAAEQASRCDQPAP